MNKEQLQNWLQPTAKRNPLVMGILNTTPDSFYDGGKYTTEELAYQRALAMIEEGADIIDIGGESAKPGAVPVSIKEEISRVIPLITKIRSISDICISIDTYKPDVMRAAVECGATIINDIRALTSDGAIDVAKDLAVPVILMHMQGDPQSMQINPSYSMDIANEINLFFAERISACLKAGIKKHNIIVDPGFGFGKTVSHNLAILKGLEKFQKHQLPILLGVSRKSTIGKILNKPPEGRLAGSLAMTAFAIMQGTSIIRAHDIAATKEVLTTLNMIALGSGINE
ncbi:MAG: dihydropteroate synthase [Legionellaceae bacterium]|nr:dihydropteroate synthase [Legionellaceae bacterium]